MDGYRLIVMKSTVPVGTFAKVTQAIAAKTDHPFDYVSNPEFMKEGAAIEDFMKPDRVVIGVSSPAAGEIMRELYQPFMRRDERILVMDPASAEMTKYAANAMLATKVSFMNEIAGLCDRFGADVEQVRRGIGTDSRIGSAFLYAGVGYGGSCFPKDLAALAAMGRAAEYAMPLARSVHDVNQRQRSEFAQRILNISAKVARKQRSRCGAGVQSPNRRHPQLRRRSTPFACSSRRAYIAPTILRCVTPLRNSAARCNVR